MQLKRGLGRGLESLMPPSVENVLNEAEGFHMVHVDSISPNRLQPRTAFDEEKIRELADSIQKQGVIQPLIVAPKSNGGYELIAGERRLRASRAIGLERVPVIIKTVDEEEMLALSLVENIQREDLNPIEEAQAYRELVEQFGHTQDDVAAKVGKSRVAVANSMRLLKLPKVIQDDVAGGRYSAGHARAMLAVESLHRQLKIRERVIREMPTVRDVEKMVQYYIGGGRKATRLRERLPAQMNEIVETMKRTLGTKVQLVTRGSGGRLIIEYYSDQDLDRIYRAIVG